MSVRCSSSTATPTWTVVNGLQWSTCTILVCPSRMDALARCRVGACAAQVRQQQRGSGRGRRLDEGPRPTTRGAGAERASAATPAAPKGTAPAAAAGGLLRGSACGGWATRSQLLLRAGAGKCWRLERRRAHPSRARLESHSRGLQFKRDAHSQALYKSHCGRQLTAPLAAVKSH